jgi:hypothetical protein
MLQLVNLTVEQEVVKKQFKAWITLLVFIVFARRKIPLRQDEKNMKKTMKKIYVAASQSHSWAVVR